MPTVTSADGTNIAYERGGSGPALVLVDGAMCYRAGGPMRPLAARLTDHFTVYAYDRRGRGESGDTLPYSPRREIEDLHAIVDAAGGEAYLFGLSSGAALVMLAAEKAKAIVLYEPPLHATHDDDYTKRLTELLDDNRRGDAVALFMTLVGMPAEVVAGFRGSPGWAPLEAIAHTLAYDDAVLRDWRPADVRALVVSGGASPQGLRDGAHRAAQAIPGARELVLDGQTHDVDPAALAPVLAEFLLADTK
ncbi:alpha/beta hydrolase [Dactylosporangium sp. AC04546]|uniref:alpha/beta fold hydrolase n=1 Tax=Dactylosporangium sp. AC04546 TaxID=2862460 RepID=UPI001EDE9AE7|nr:alpha/beta hydrolase [Dactylosporangium sp. AC04546]WVK89616.1 alpha/beta hydrolase [Dactylosporangium sp. AC04546]